MKKKSSKGEVQQLKKIVLPHLENTDKIRVWLASVYPELSTYFGLDTTDNKNKDTIKNDWIKHCFPILYLPRMQNLADKYSNPQIVGKDKDDKDVQVDDPNGAKEQIIRYILRIRQTVKYAFQMQKMEQLLEDIINNIDQPSEIYLTQIPRYKKLQRLRKLNEQVIDFFLTTLHNYYWSNLPANKTTNENINEIIKRITPITVNLHKALLDELHYEFPKDLNEEAIYY